MNRAKHLKTKGIYFLYRILQVFGLPALLLYFLIRGLRNAGYWRSLPQRFGFLPRSFRQTGPGAIWLHAVSVGEVLACLALLRKLRSEFPHTAVFVSTSTLAGHAMAAERLAGLARGVFFAPVDYVFAVRRVIRALRPSVVVIAETEIWPNLIREVKRTGAGLTIVNGRISDKALPRYLKLRWFFEAALPSIDSVLAQSETMRKRFVELGAPRERVISAGNLKFDFEARPAPPDSPAPAFIESLKPDKVWIAASTTAPAAPDDVDEDDIVIAAFQDLARRRPNLCLILAPRKPERFDSAADKLEAAGIRFTRRTQLPGNGAHLPHVLLLDSIGELSGLFSHADAVFMGGTLTCRGGHNILEPALFAKPVIVGPHMENFQSIADDLREAGALAEIGAPAELGRAVERLLSDPEFAVTLGRRARACAEARRGAAARAVAEVRALHSAAVPRYRPAMPWFALAWILSKLWGQGARIAYARKLAHRQTLDVPVVSIGNVTMGGTGKTPCVLLVAERLKDRGRAPAILTRGYGRSSTSRQLALGPGAAVSTEHSGDEPQIYVRSGVAPVGIGGDRVRAAELLKRKFRFDTLLLDDGFQHVRLARDVDIVLIDALEPFGRGGLFPLGRLREPLSSLARAHIILITRSHFSDLEAAITREVRVWNAGAPIFRAGVQPRTWVEHRTGKHYDVNDRPFQAAGAFCGLGNPRAFRYTLEALGVNLVQWVEFEDHHRYRPHELSRIAHQSLASGATALITTEKDSVNLCHGCNELTAPLEIYWLKIAMRVEREDEFIQHILSRLN